MASGHRSKQSTWQGEDDFREQCCCCQEGEYGTRVGDSSRRVPCWFLHARQHGQDHVACPARHARARVRAGCARLGQWRLLHSRRGHRVSGGVVYPQAGNPLVCRDRVGVRDCGQPHRRLLDERDSAHDFPHHRGRGLRPDGRYRRRGNLAVVPSGEARPAVGRCGSQSQMR